MSEFSHDSCHDSMALPNTMERSLEEDQNTLLENPTNYGIDVEEMMALPNAKEIVEEDQNMFSENSTNDGIDEEEINPEESLAEQPEMEQTMSDLDYIKSDSEGSDSFIKKTHIKLKPKSPKIFACTQCPEEFKVGKRLRAHIAIVHDGNPPYRCEVCQKPIAEKYKLIDHMKTHSNERQFACEECGKTFKFKCNMTQHYRLYHGPEKDDRFQCELCPKVFATKFRLKNHLVIHSEECKYSCKICGRKFKRSTNLQEHKRIHSAEKKFECPQCGLHFKRKYDLTVHGRNHMEVKPYKCEFCPASFTQMHALKNHVRLHTGERPYKCTICERSFVQQGTLQVHVKRHTGEKDFKCEFCGQAFMLKRSLTDHVRIHTGEKPYECPQCPYRSATSVGLACHLKTHERQLKRKLEKEKLQKEMENSNENGTFEMLDMTCQSVDDEKGKRKRVEKMVVKICGKKKRKTSEAKKTPRKKIQKIQKEIPAVKSVSSSTMVEEITGDLDADSSEFNVIEIFQENEPLPVMLVKNKSKVVESELRRILSTNITSVTFKNVDNDPPSPSVASLKVKQSPDLKLSHPTLFSALNSSVKIFPRMGEPLARNNIQMQKPGNGTRIGNQMSKQNVSNENGKINIKTEPVEISENGEIDNRTKSIETNENFVIPDIKSEPIEILDDFDENLYNKNNREATCPTANKMGSKSFAIQTVETDVAVHSGANVDIKNEPMDW